MIVDDEESIQKDVDINAIPDDVALNIIMNIEENTTTHLLLSTLEAIVDKVRNIRKFFRHSSVGTDILAKYTKKDFGQDLKLKQDCKIRWNSLFLMLERFVQIKPCVVQIAFQA